MEVCGTHTMSIARYGLRELLPEGMRLVSGPGCPVCVPQTSMNVRSGRASARRAAARRSSSSACVIGLEAVVRREGADLAQQLERLVGLGLVDHADGEAGVHEHVVAELGFGYEHEAGALLEACRGDGRQRAS